ncbi:hypothetical protein C0992_011878 [Termitomyces sp. T32_za158]|nr:hypothetical protein C0992_011878 [Termitomyces sp. T32_za158]
MDHVLRHPEFCANAVLLGIDEAHVLTPWGKEFRPVYKQIENLRHRLSKHCITVAVTATLSPGKETNALCKSLGFKAENSSHRVKFHLVRLSCERSNVRTIIMELRTPLTGWIFPDIQWVFITSGIKGVIYCASLDLQLRVALYGWNQFERGPQRLEYVRLWSSITSPAYNRRTLELFETNPQTCAIIATVAFGLGMNIRNITDSINLGVPDTVEALVQQNGRTGRDLETEARSWTYIEPALAASVREFLLDTAPEPLKNVNTCGQDKKSKGKTWKTKEADSSGKEKRLVEDKIKAIVAAHLQGKCINIELNKFLGNTDGHALFACQPKSPSMPPGFVISQSLPSEHPANAQRIKTRIHTAPLPQPLTKKYRVHAHAMLHHFACEHLLIKNTAHSQYSTTADFWTGVDLEGLIFTIHLLRSKEAMDVILDRWKYLKHDGKQLFLLIEGLNATYESDIMQTREKRSRAAAVTRAANNTKKRTMANATDKENNDVQQLLTIWLPARRPALLLTHNTLDVSGQPFLSSNWEPPPWKIAFANTAQMLASPSNALDEPNFKRQRKLCK